MKKVIDLHIGLSILALLSRLYGGVGEDSAIVLHLLEYSAIVHPLPLQGEK